MLKHGTRFHSYILCAIAALLVACAGTAPAEEVDDTAFAAKVIAEAPAPPKQKASSLLGMFVAGGTGRLKIIDLKMPVPENVVVKEDVEYGKVGNRSLLLDLYSPKEVPKPVPGIIFVHGGGWVIRDRKDFRYHALCYAKRGYVATSINYRLAQHAPFPGAVQDVKCAVRWMRANASTLHVDPEKIALVGASAGGHLSLLAAYATDVPEFEKVGGHPEMDSSVQAVVDLYGPPDMTAGYVRHAAYFIGFFGKDWYRRNRELYRKASPIYHVDSSDPPTLILHGTKDSIVPVEESDRLAAKLEEAGVPYVYDRLDGWPHAMDFALEVNKRFQYFTDAFFSRYLPLPEQ